MALQLYKIASVEVPSGGQSSVTFSSIPQGYTDLKIVCSVRDTGGGVTNNIIVAVNGVTTSQSVKQLGGTGSSAYSASDTPIYAYGAVSGGATANTFSNCEIYIPNYASTTTNKSVSLDFVTENNATAGYQTLAAGLYASNTAITSLAINANGTSFAQYSTFTLYGIL